MNEPKRFQRTIEDFTCDKCGSFVKGDGYTNHCSKCLWSKHVDIHPGDRNSVCGGMMEPTAIERKNDRYILTHTCTKCGTERKNSLDEHDNFDAAIAIVTRKK